MFFDFANFYGMFIKNFNKIAVSLNSILQITDNRALSTQATENKNQDVSANTGDTSDTSDRNGKSIKNLSTITNLAKSKESKLTRSKRLDLLNTNVNFGTDFVTTKAKEAFIHLQKAFTKALILRHFDLRCHIWIETNVLRYAIGGSLIKWFLINFFLVTWLI